jgi:hypothetical protein
VVSPFVADLGVRYMFNNKFGVKADLVTITSKMEVIQEVLTQNIIEQTYKLLQTWEV